MSKNILFWPDVYKEQGHWLPTLVWANGFFEESGEEYSVHYMGIKDCESIVGDFTYHSIFQNMYPLGYTTKSHTSPSDRWKPWHIWAILYSQFTDAQLSDLDSMAPDEKLLDDAKSLRDVWAEVAPNLLVSGYFTSLETLLIYWIYKARTGKTDLHFAISTTFLRHPQDDPAIRALQNLQAFSKTEQFKIMNLALYGEISIEEPEMTLEEFVKPLETIDEFIPCPEAFDFSRYTHADLSHYVEPCIKKNQEPKETVDSDGNTVVWSDVISEHENIIFVTAGSQVLDYEDRARNLFHSMCIAMQSEQMRSYFLIIGAGYTLTNSDEWQCYSKDNLLIANWVPQNDLLAGKNSDGSAKVKCALIHGGLATVKECVYYGRNFVVIPLGKDQIDNALRLQEHNIDTVLNVADITPKALLSAINKAMTDYRSKNALSSMSRIFQSYEDASSLDVSRIGYKALKALADKIDA